MSKLNSTEGLSDWDPVWLCVGCMVNLLLLFFFPHNCWSYICRETVCLLSKCIWCKSIMHKCFSCLMIESYHQEISMSIKSTAYFRRFAQLRSLNLSHNGLGVFPESLCEIQTLTELYLSCNGLSAVPARLENLQRSAHITPPYSAQHTVCGCSFGQSLTTYNILLFVCCCSWSKTENLCSFSWTQISSPCSWQSDLSLFVISLKCTNVPCRSFEKHCTT